MQLLANEAVVTHDHSVPCGTKFCGSNFFAIFAFFQRSIMFVLKPCNLKRRQNVLEDSLDSWYSQKLIIKNLRSRNGSFIKGKVV